MPKFPLGPNILSVIANSGASGIITSGRRGMRNPAVEYNVAAFSELSFVVRWKGRLSMLSRGYYYE